MPQKECQKLWPLLERDAKLSHERKPYGGPPDPPVRIGHGDHNPADNRVLQVFVFKWILILFNRFAQEVSGYGAVVNLSDYGEPQIRKYQPACYSDNTYDNDILEDKGKPEEQKYDNGYFKDSMSCYNPETHQIAAIVFKGFNNSVGK